MATTKVVFFSSKVYSNNESPVLIRITQNRKTSYINTGIRCKREDWDFTNNIPVKKHPLFLEIKLLLEKKQMEATKLLLNIEDDSQDYNAAELKNKISKKQSKKMSVLSYFDFVIQRLETEGRIGYANIFQTTKASISNFNQKKDIPFSEINQDFIERFEKSFSERSVKPNSVFVFLRTFKTLINYARKDEIVKQEFNPFKNIDFRKYRKIKTQKRALTKEEMKKIEVLELEPGTLIYHAQKYFMFSFYCRGINFSDMAFLKWSNIRENRLEYVRLKTKEQFSIGILDPAIEIIKYYKENHFQGDDGYIFPILSETHQTPRSIDNRIDKVLKMVNRELKNIAGITNLDKNLTTYVARHSFATIVKRSGISTSVISELLGHDSEKTTQIYLDSFENVVLDEATKVIL